jgi:hypothetical protein
MWTRVNSFFVKGGTCEEHAVIANELTWCYQCEAQLNLQLQLQHKIKPSHLQWLQSRKQIILWKNKYFTPYEHYRPFGNFVACLFTLGQTTTWSPCKAMLSVFVYWNDLLITDYKTFLLYINSMHMLLVACKWSFGQKPTANTSWHMYHISMLKTWKS